MDELAQIKDRKQQEDKPTLPSSATRPRTSPPQSHIEDTIGENTAIGDNEEEINPLEYWRREFGWPKEYFEPGSNMDHQLAKRSSSYFRGKAPLPLF